MALTISFLRKLSQVIRVNKDTIFTFDKIYTLQIYFCLFTYTDEVTAVFTVHIIGFALTVFDYGTSSVNSITYEHKVISNLQDQF